MRAVTSPHALGAPLLGDAPLAQSGSASAASSGAPPPIVRSDTPWRRSLESPSWQRISVGTLNRWTDVLGGRTIDLHAFWGDAAFRLAVYESRAPDKAPHRWRENEYLLRVALRHRR